MISYHDTDADGIPNTEQRRLTFRAPAASVSGAEGTTETGTLEEEREEAAAAVFHGERERERNREGTSTLLLRLEMKYTLPLGHQAAEEE